MNSPGSTPSNVRDLETRESSPLVSIITPCFNGEDHVARLIESVLAQTYPNIEFILVDDGSTDGTDQVVRSYEPRLRQRLSRFVHVRQENSGLGGAINAGLKHVTGEFLCWPDADDYLEPTSVSERVAVLEDMPEVAVVTSDAWIRETRSPSQVVGRVSASFGKSNEPWQFEHLLRAESIFTPGCHMARMVMFDETHPRREIFPARRGQNWQILLPLYHKYPRYFLDRPLYNYMVDPGSMSRGDTTLGAQIHRIDEHRKIKRQALNSIRMSDDERDGWERVVDELRERKVLDIAAKAGDRALAQESHRRLRELAQPTGRDRLRLRAKLVQAMVTRPVGTAAATPRLAPSEGGAAAASGRPIETVSALITTYNGARFIEAQLDSIAQQTLPVTQVVIADDGSSDGTVSIVERFISTKGLIGWALVRNESNLGPASNVLTHLKGLDGDLVLLADQDDIWEANKVEVIAGYLSRDPALDLVVSRSRVIDAEGHFTDSRARSHVSARKCEDLDGRSDGTIRLTFSNFLGHSSIPLHAMGVRGTLMRTIADLPEFPALSKSLGADWFIGMMSTVSGQAAVVPEALVRRRVHDANISLGRLRKTTALASSNSARIRMLQEARRAHRFLLEEAQIRDLLSEAQIERLEDMVVHLGRRISFTADPSLWLAARLLMRLNRYVRSADAFVPGVRMWVADVMYAYGINWRLRWKGPHAGNG